MRSRLDLAGKLCQPSSKWVPFSNHGRIRKRKEWDGLSPRYIGQITPTAPMAIRLWETFTFLCDQCLSKSPPPLTLLKVVVSYFSGSEPNHPQLQLIIVFCLINSSQVSVSSTHSFLSHQLIIVFCLINSSQVSVSSTHHRFLSHQLIIVFCLIDS